MFHIDVEYFLVHYMTCSPIKHKVNRCVFCRNLDSALDEFSPDVIVYNAGTDILEGDPLGNLSITPKVSMVYS